MTDMPALGWSRGRRGRARADQPSGPGRNARSRGREAVTIISAPAGSLPAAPEFNGQAMVDRTLSELAASAGPFVLIIDDLRELSSG